ncbi:O-antigen ligase family protein [Solibacillus merdavium]|uniref:O-antigen ligase family protein n=1 Tax=Solibacillus merdavium TaxID=2762218 RepID=A0ABR8XKW3_9BACL|nr:O-antigen ligase family protein [Solibacillus merdavium]MBD8032573.1 O-antigen ligase family protein [Solibacillus merdavium]
MASFYEELNKSTVINDEIENTQSRANIDKWIFRLFLFLIAVMPLIVMANVKEVVSPLISNIDVLTSGIKGDLFTHYKLIFIVSITIITFGMLMLKIFFMEGIIRKTALNYILAVFTVAIIISTIASPNITIALNGQYNRSDGAISWLCYIALLFVAINIKYPKNAVPSIMYAMIPFVFINLYIIAMNFYGNDLLQAKWLQNLVSILLPEGANISESSLLVGTLNQWNYMSGMFAIMSVMYLAWAVLSKKWVEVIIGSITAAASLAILLMSISTSGFLTIIVILPLILILSIKNSEKQKSITALVISLIIIVPIFHILSKENDRVWEESFGFFVDINPYSKEEASSLGYGFSYDNKVYASEKALELPVLPERYLAFGTGRGYIWNETLEMVKERPLTGYGNDSLVYNFPHYQLESRAGMLDENTIVDKAHNIYIAILYGTGIFGFIALISIIIWNVTLVLRALVQKNNINSAVLILGVAVLAYSVQALFNDSIPAITAVVFIFLGIVFSHGNKLNPDKE